MAFDHQDFSIQSLTDAAKTLEEAVSSEPKNELERDGVIQRFEYTFELSWKVLKKYLELYYGIRGVSIKDVFREAGNQGLIDSVEDWFGYLKSRNLTSHTYHGKTAGEVYKAAVNFSEDVKVLIRNLEKKLA